MIRLVGLLVVMVSLVVVRPERVWAFSAPFQAESIFSVDTEEIGLRLVSEGTLRESGGEATLPGFQAIYRFVSFLELELSLPLELRSRTGSSTRYGLASASVGLSVRPYQARGESWLPSLGVSPKLQFPSPCGVGSEHVRAYFPIIVEKKLGAWSALANLALGLDPEPGNRHTVFVGAILTRPVSDSFGLGAELFFRSSSSVEAPSVLGFNLGAKYQSGRQALYASLGRGLRNARRTNRFSAYLAYQISF